MIFQMIILFTYDTSNNIAHPIIIDKYGALFVEDAAESMGATYNGKQTGSFGDYSAISYNGNKMITGSSGGCLLIIISYFLMLIPCCIFSCLRGPLSYLISHLQVVGK